MDLNDKVTQLEDEIKILKNEVQSVLLDLRESFLQNVNPFNPNAIIANPQPVKEIQIPDNDNENFTSIHNKNEIPDLDNETNTDIDFSGIDESAEINLSEEDYPKESTDDDDSISKATVSFMTDSNGNGNSTQTKENTMDRHPDAESETLFRSGDAARNGKADFDLGVIGDLSEWVEESVRRLGHEKTRIILDVTETMGYITPELKNILVKFIHPAYVENDDTSSRQDLLSLLIELNNLLGTDNRIEIALLYILCQEYEDR